VFSSLLINTPTEQTLTARDVISLAIQGILVLGLEVLNCDQIFSDAIITALINFKKDIPHTSSFIVSINHSDDNFKAV
jgi:hypothetical protein